MKYNILNCPAFNKEEYECGCIDTEHLCCWMNEDCIMKQIVKKCKETDCDCLIEKRKCGAMDNMSMCCDLWKSKDILNPLEIEEVE